MKFEPVVCDAAFTTPVVYAPDEFALKSEPTANNAVLTRSVTYNPDELANTSEAIFADEETYNVEVLVALITFKLSEVINVSVIVELPTSNDVVFVDELPIVIELVTTRALTVMLVVVMLDELTTELTVALPTLIVEVVRFTLAPTLTAVDTFAVPVMSAPAPPVIKPEALTVFAFTTKRLVAVPNAVPDELEAG